MAGLKAFRQQLRKGTRTKGLLGLNKIKGLAARQQVCPPTSCPRGSRGSLGSPAMCPPAGSGRSMLEEVLHQQRSAHYTWLFTGYCCCSQNRIE